MVKFLPPPHHTHSYPHYHTHRLPLTAATQFYSFSVTRHPFISYSIEVKHTLKWNTSKWNTHWNCVEGTHNGKNNDESELEAPWWNDSHVTCDTLPPQRPPLPAAGPVCAKYSRTTVQNIVIFISVVGFEMWGIPGFEVNGRSIDLYRPHLKLDISE